MNANTQVGHRHEASYRYAMSAHAGVNLGTCNCGTKVREFEIQGRRIAIERSADKTSDLFDRACSLGYTQESAATLADCWVNYNQVSDPCMIHPNHSVTTDMQGFAVDGCEACKVLILTDDAGFTQAGWAVTQAERAAELAALVAEEAAQYAAEEAILTGQPTQVTPCGTFALGETVTHTEMGTGTVAYLGSAGGMEIEFDGGNTIGVDEDHYGEWSQVRTDAPGTFPSNVEMAEAERDEMIEFNRAQAVARNQARDAMIAEGRRRAQGPDGIEILRELLTLPTVPARKVKSVHLNDGAAKAPCGANVADDRANLNVGRSTHNPSEVTCKRCPATRRFAKFAERTAREAAQAAYVRAGLRTGMVVRQITTGRLGMITRLDSMIQVGFWVGESVRPYASVAEFDQACEIVIMADLVPVGTRLASNLGGEAVVLGVTAISVRFRRYGESKPVDVTPSEFAAELSRGWLAVVPTIAPATVRVSQVIKWTYARNHYAIVTDVNKVNPGSATMSLHTLGGDQYGQPLDLYRLAWDLASGQATISERPIGSWR